jgi:hypothetical protein
MKAKLSSKNSESKINEATVMRVKFASSLAMAMCAVLVGCATVLPAPDELEKLSKLRSELFWKNVVETKYDAAYAMLTDASKQAIPSRRFVQQVAALRVSGAQVAQVKCIEGTCAVKLTLDVAMRVPKIGAQKVSFDHEDVWLYESGEMRLVRK